MQSATAVQRAKEPTTTAIQRSSLFERMNEVLDKISQRAFEVFERNGGTPGRELENWLTAEREVLHPLPINITESSDSLEVEAEVPGFNERELEIAVQPNRVTITGMRETAKEEKKGKTIYSECGCNQILRVLDLPVEIDPEKATATLTNGVLQLALPKTATRSRTVRIEPKAAA